MRLKDKVAIITGGANGIGLAAAKRFIEEGAQVVIADYNEVAGSEAVQAFNGSAIFIQVDVSKKESVQQLIEKTIEQYGKIDVLINNAGITRDAMLVKLSEEDFDAVIDVNLKGVFYCTQAVVPIMVANGAGKIINTSSVTGVYGNIGQTNYAASKAAVVGMTKTWAKELGRKGINVNAVAPGLIQTAMVETMPQQVIDNIQSQISLGTLGQAEDVANAYVFLASEEAKYITGHTLHIDGGIMM